MTNDLDLQIEMLTNQLEFAKAKKKALKDEGIQLAEMIANAHVVGRYRAETSGGDIYIMLGGEDVHERISFKLSRQMASDFVVAVDDKIQELDEQLPVNLPQVNYSNDGEDRPVDIAEIFAHPDIQKLLANIFGTEDEKKSA